MSIILNRERNEVALAKKMGVGYSKTFTRILKILMTQDEMRLVLVTPGTPHEIAVKLEEDEKTIAEILHDLYMRGVVIIKEMADDGPRYDLADPGNFMDCIMFDTRYDKFGENFFELWKVFYNDEFVPAQANNSFNFRVLPLEKTIKATRILSYEQASVIIESAKKVALQLCACRRRERNCDNPLKTCISLNELADYVLDRHLGREITKGEALNLLKDCEKLNLVHQTVNTDSPDVICNCCPCCCSLLRAVIYHGSKAALSKSRFRPRVDSSKCRECLRCTRVCYFGAMVNENSQRSYIEENCYGCGLCAENCPNDAIRLIEVLPKEHIPSGSGFCPSLVPEKVTS